MNIIRTRYFFLSAIGVVTLVVTITLVMSWLNKPSPIPLDDPIAQQIKDVLSRSYEIRNVLFCDSKADLIMLEEVFVNTSDFKPNNREKRVIAKYLGKSAIKQAGYLTFMTAYHLWSRSDDPYPGRPISSLDILYPSKRLTPTPKPIRYCPENYTKPNIILSNIAIHDDKAIVTYDAPPNYSEATLMNINGRWYIAKIRVLQQNF